MSNVITSKTLLSISELSFAFGPDENTSPVISNLSLNAKASEIVSILGASGCGKSTLLNLIAGLLSPSKGKIDLAGNTNSNQIGYIFQNDALFPWQTVESNLMLVTKINKEIKILCFLLCVSSFTENLEFITQRFTRTTVESNRFNQFL